MKKCISYLAIAVLLMGVPGAEPAHAEELRVYGHAPLEIGWDAPESTYALEIGGIAIPSVEEIINSLVWNFDFSTGNWLFQGFGQAPAAAGGPLDFSEVTWGITGLINRMSFWNIKAQETPGLKVDACWSLAENGDLTLQGLGECPTLPEAPTSTVTVNRRDCFAAPLPSPTTDFRGITSPPADTTITIFTQAPHGTYNVKTSASGCGITQRVLNVYGDRNIITPVACGTPVGSAIVTSTWKGVHINSGVRLWVPQSPNASQWVPVDRDNPGTLNAHPWARYFPDVGGDGRQDTIYIGQFISGIYGISVSGENLTSTRPHVDMFLGTPQGDVQIGSAKYPSIFDTGGEVEWIAGIVPVAEGPEVGEWQDCLATDCILPLPF